MLFYCVFFFFNDTAPTEIYTLSLHDALPIYTTGYIDHAAFLGTINPDTNKSGMRSEERFSRNAETDLVCRLLLEKKKKGGTAPANHASGRDSDSDAQPHHNVRE